MRWPLLVGIGVVAAVAAFQLWISPANPPGFFRDEAAIAYNAHTIATEGRDEYGARFPLYFSSFLDYKSPLFVYGLAGVFRVTGPDREVARGFAAVCVLAAILLLGWLRVSTKLARLGRGRDRRPGRDDAMALRAVRLPEGGPPIGAVAFGRTQECDDVCERLDESGDYWIASVVGPPG